MNLFTFFLVGACTGISVLFSQSFGKGADRELRNVFFQSFIFGLVISAFLATGGIAGLGVICTLIRVPSSLISPVRIYLAVVLLGLPATYVYNLCSALLRSAGQSAIAGFTAATRIEGFANSFGDSGCAATAVFIGQAYGAGEGALAASVSYLRLISVFYLFCFTGNTFAGYFDGIGKVQIPFAGAASHITLRIILSALLIEKMGLSSVALACGAGWIYASIFWAVLKRHRTVSLSCGQRLTEPGL